TLGQCKGSTRAWFREKTPFTPASAASSRTASARGGAQLREEPREISELVMRVEPAGIGEHPDSCHPYDLALQAQRGLGAIEGGAVRHDPEHGEIARAIAAHLRRQTDRAAAQLVDADLVPRRPWRAGRCSSRRSPNRGARAGRTARARPR